MRPSKPRDPSQWPIAKSELERAPAPTDPGEAAYRRTCIACHGVDGRGNGGTTAADLTRADGVRTFSDDALRTVIRDGRHGAIGVMPAHRGILTPNELEAVMGFVRRRYAIADVPTPAPSDAPPQQAPAPTATR